jgi:hypothetical protein
MTIRQKYYWVILALLLIAGIFILQIQCKYYNEDDLYLSPTDCDTTMVTYTMSIKAIFEANCYICHSTAIASGGIILDTYDGAIIPAKAGILWKAVSHEPGFSFWMPKDRPQLPECELAKIRIWISLGEPN